MSNISGLQTRCQWPNTAEGAGAHMASAVPKEDDPTQGQSSLVRVKRTSNTSSSTQYAVYDDAMEAASDQENQPPDLKIAGQVDETMADLDHCCSWEMRQFHSILDQEQVGCAEAAEMKAVCADMPDTTRGLHPAAISCEDQQLASPHLTSNDSAVTSPASVQDLSGSCVKQTPTTSPTPTQALPDAGLLPAECIRPATFRAHILSPLMIPPIDLPPTSPLAQGHWAPATSSTNSWQQGEQCDAPTLASDYAGVLQSAFQFCGQSRILPPPISRHTVAARQLPSHHVEWSAVPVIPQARPNTGHSPQHTSMEAADCTAASDAALRRPLPSMIDLYGGGNDVLELHEALEHGTHAIEEVEAVVQQGLAALREADPCEGELSPEMALQSSSNMVRLLLLLALVQRKVALAKAFAADSSPLSSAASEVPAAPAALPCSTDEDGTGTELHVSTADGVTSRLRAAIPLETAHEHSAFTQWRLPEDAVHQAVVDYVLDAADSRGASHPWCAAKAEAAAVSIKSEPPASPAPSPRRLSRRGTLRRAPSAGTLKDAADLITRMARGPQAAQHSRNPAAVHSPAAARSPAPAGSPLAVRSRACVRSPPGMHSPLGVRSPPVTRSPAATCSPMDGRARSSVWRSDSARNLCAVSSHDSARKRARTAIKAEPMDDAPAGFVKTEQRTPTPSPTSKPDAAAVHSRQLSGRLTLAFGPRLDIVHGEDASLSPAAAARLAVVAQERLARTSSLARTPSSSRAAALQHVASSPQASPLARAPSLARASPLTRANSLARASPLARANSLARAASPATRTGRRAIGVDNSPSPSVSRKRRQQQCDTPAAGSQPNTDFVDALMAMMALPPKEEQPAAPAARHEPLSTVSSALPEDAKLALLAVQPALPSPHPPGTPGASPVVMPALEQQLLSRMMALQACSQISDAMQTHGGFQYAPAPHPLPALTVRVKDEEEECGLATGPAWKPLPTSCPPQPSISPAGLKNVRLGLAPVHLTPLVLDIGGRDRDGKLLHCLQPRSGLTPATPDAAEPRCGWADPLQSRLACIGQLLSGQEAARDAAGSGPPSKKRC